MMITALESWLTLWDKTKVDCLSNKTARTMHKDMKTQLTRIHPHLHPNPHLDNLTLTYFLLHIHTYT